MEEFTLQEKQAIFKSIINMTITDCTVSNEEMDFSSKVLDTLNLSQADAEDIQQTPEETRSIVGCMTPEKKQYFLNLLIDLIHVDGVDDPEEDFRLERIKGLLSL